LPTPPTAEQKQKKRTYDVLPKPDNFIRYRQRLPYCAFEQRHQLTTKRTHARNHLAACHS
jgi:hypothetical protein